MDSLGVGQGIPALTGPFLLAATAYAAAVVLFPRPFLLARSLTANADDDALGAGASLRLTLAW